MNAWAAAVLLAAALAAGAAQAEARPQMSPAEAARHQVADYLAQGGTAWQPERLDARSWRADFVVAADGSGSHRSLQAAIDAVPARADAARRHYIRLRPGHYRETVCLKSKAPVTIYGDPADAAAVVVVQGHYAGLAKRAGIDAANPCMPNLSAPTYGTSGSASVALFSDDVQLAHLTIANDAMEGVRENQAGAQAVALMTQGDRLQLEDVRLLGHQDTFYVRSPAPGAGARVYVHASLIAGDVDFVFGSATLVLDNCRLHSRAGRVSAGQGGPVLAPSTVPGTSLGFLVVNSRFTADPGLLPGAAALGRAWDMGVPPGTWVAGLSPNGQALVRESRLGPHIGPWAASTSRRPFSAGGEQGNRLTEYRNRVQAEDIAREALGPNDGWAAAEGGTRGGADALAADVTDVRTRAELVAALAPHPRPRIVRVHGQIDLSVDDTGRPLGFDDYRDAAFDWGAYARAYDPAHWGRMPPAGAQEEARKRSALRQAERVVLRLPSRTTLVGVGRDAGLRNGTLMLDRVDNVILRNLHFSDAYDHFPAWDPRDNAQGEWNSEYDNVALRGASHVWIDHCSFDDGARPDRDARILLGRPMQHHDGLLDITQQSNYVTVSWNHFRDHDKTTLVGGSDAQVLDRGLLKVTFHHNLWERVRERTPRVRYGQVHLYNNLFLVDPDGPNGYAYSIGVGHESRILSERNVWQTPDGVAPTQLLRLLKGHAFFDRESLHNGRPVDLLAALRGTHAGVPLSGDVGWQAPYAAALDPAADVAAKVRAGAGAGRGPIDPH